MGKNLITLILLVLLAAAFALPAYANTAEPERPGSERVFVEGLLDYLECATYWGENYRYSHWDCTNQAALLCAILEPLGIEVRIVTGQFPGAWCWHALVEVKLDGEICRIEPTWLGFYEDGELEQWGWRERTSYTLEHAQTYHWSEYHWPKLDYILSPL